MFYRSKLQFFILVCIILFRRNDAKETRSKVEKELQPMDLKEAQRLAKEWTKSHNK